MLEQFFINNAYVLLFLGLLFSGETFLLPAIYLGIEGVLDLSSIFLISLLATAISDTFWYWLGRMMSIEKISSLRFLSKYEKQVFSLSGLFQKNGLLILFLSKFVYGTRTATQILCGTTKIIFYKYFFVNLLGISALNLFFITIGFVSKESLTKLTDAPAKLWGSFFLFVTIAVILQVLFKKFVWQKWFQQ